MVGWGNGWVAESDSIANSAQLSSEIAFSILPLPLYVIIEGFSNVVLIAGNKWLNYHSRGR